MRTRPQKAMAAGVTRHSETIARNIVGGRYLVVKVKYKRGWEIGNRCLSELVTFLGDDHIFMRRNRRCTKDIIGYDLLRWQQ